MVPVGLRQQDMHFPLMFHLQALSRLHLKFHDFGVNEALRLRFLKLHEVVTDVCLQMSHMSDRQVINLQG